MYVSITLYSVFRCWSYYLLEVKLGIVESSAHRRPQKLPAASSRQEPDYATRFLSGMVQRHNISPGPYGASWVTLNYGAVPRRENGTCARCGNGFIAINCKKCGKDILLCRDGFIKYPEKRSHCEVCRPYADGECPVIYSASIFVSRELRPPRPDELLWHP